ncbi:MAG TPA: hypothetical protein VJ692_08260 [Nitrospiraceae bacterium]|nr:hypothetical protein [Nitrospiraceae bacterium]
MTGAGVPRAESLIFLLAMWCAGCGHPGSPLELSDVDPFQDQWKIAQYHQREAIVLLQKAEDLKAQVLVYEGLFGADSPWVTGAQLLVQSYEEAAREQERLADKHLALAGRRPERRLSRPTFP